MIVVMVAFVFYSRRCSVGHVHRIRLFMMTGDMCIERP